MQNVVRKYWRVSCHYHVEKVLILNTQLLQFVELLVRIHDNSRNPWKLKGRIFLSLKTMEIRIREVAEKIFFIFGYFWNFWFGGSSRRNNFWLSVIIGFKSTLATQKSGLKALLLGIGVPYLSLGEEELSRGRNFFGIGCEHNIEIRFFKWSFVISNRFSSFFRV